MGIGYEDSVIVYNRYVTGNMETEIYIGTRFDNVRVELTQGANIRKSGIENADSCLVKIPNNGSISKSYKPSKIWNALTDDEKQDCFTLDAGNHDFFVVVKKDELGINIDIPEGIVQSDQYNGGFYQYVRNTYGYAYAVKTVDVYNLISRFEVSGK